MITGEPITVSVIAERLGLTLLNSTPGTVGEATVSHVVLHDEDRRGHGDGALVLGVGLSRTDDIVRTLAAFAGGGAVALVVREPFTIDEDIRRALSLSKVALLGMLRDATWLQMANYIGELLAQHDVEGGERETSTPEADLFDLANSIAAVIDGPVTIENLSSRILAFSADQARGDEARKQSVLGHQVPSHYGELLKSSGMFTRIYGSTTPVYIDSLGDGIRPRVGMRIKAASQLLGSIWAIVDGPLSEQQNKALVDAAAVAALSLLRSRVASDAAQRLRLSEVLTFIGGGAPAKEAAERLGYGSSSITILAIGFAESSLSTSAEEEAAVQHLAGSVGMYLHQIHPLSVVAPVGGTVYAVLPRARHQPDDDFVRRIAVEFTARFRHDRSTVIGIGETVVDATALERSRDEADRALRVLRSSWNSERRSVAKADEVQVESLLLRLSDSLTASREQVTGPLALLQQHDLEHGTELVETLRAWLDAFGDASVAARALHLHVNTFRYRLRKLTTTAGIDLTSPDARFSLMLQLRLFFPASGFGE